MENLDLDTFDFMILRQLYPNFKKSILNIVSDINKIIFKKVEYLNKHDLKEYLNIEKTNRLKRNDLIECSLNILFSFTVKNLEENVQTRINSSLLKLSIFDQNQVYLTDYGKKLYSKLDFEKREITKYYQIKFKRITDLSTFKSKLIIVEDKNRDKDMFLQLRWFDLRQAHINPWELVDNLFYIKCAIDELGILKQIIKISRTPINEPNKETFKIISFFERSYGKSEYVIQSITSNLIYSVKALLIEHFIDLCPEFWNYNEGEYENIRSGINIELSGVIYSYDKIFGFESIVTCHEISIYLDQTILNLFEIDTSFNLKDYVGILSTERRIIILAWNDIETSLDIPKKDIIKFKSKLKRRGEDVFLIKVEGEIKKQENLFLQNNTEIIRLFIDEPIIDTITPLDTN